MFINFYYLTQQFYEVLKSIIIQAIFLINVVTGNSVTLTTFFRRLEEKWGGWRAGGEQALQPLSQDCSLQPLGVKSILSLEGRGCIPPCSF